MEAKQRIFFLDNIKILLAIVVILVHAGQPYGPGGEWFINHPAIIPIENTIIIGIFFAVSSSYFMGLFFFISAYFLPGSYDRKGARKFLQDRLIRLGIPLTIMLILGFPLLFYFLYNSSQTTFTQYYLHNTFFTSGNPELLSFGYLWFVVLLLIFGILYLCWRAFRFPNRPVPCPNGHSLFLYAVCLGIATFLVRIWFPFDKWMLFHAIEPAHLPQYLFLFTAGVLAYRNNWLNALSSTLTRMWGPVTIAGILLLLPIYFAFGTTITEGGFTIASCIYSFWESFVGIGMCLCLIIIFRDRWNIPGRIKKVLAENVYAVYLIHLPIVVTLQWIFIPVEIPSLLKFFAVGTAGILCIFSISNYVIRKIPYAEKVIF